MLAKKDISESFVGEIELSIGYNFEHRLFKNVHGL